MLFIIYIHNIIIYVHNTYKSNFNKIILVHFNKCFNNITQVKYEHQIGKAAFIYNIVQW